MGENEGWLQPPNGLLPNEGGSVMRVLDNERWAKAEERTAELIACIQPNAVSEERRSAVAVYVQKLIMKCFPCQVFTFGSVPLKTYLPDGDIDLTAFSYDQSFKETWANQVRDALENEKKNEKAEFRVKDVQYIQAEVKIIKCLVGNIVVDISFNQLGGLCTLCFLEQVDKLISQNHLFKRSIILIKAWCYYESRILGAHHGLISTYALETLVLYIFHVFNTFSGPLEVLYRFLEFFSKFDWDNFCISLWGPVPINLLPDATAAEPPRKDGGDLLLTKLFLDACSLAYSVSPPQEHQGHPFISKHFNIIDPLRANNNLGRSVSKGNFFRIRSAFAFGAKSLARVLECPKEDIFKELNQFFANTWDRHGSGPRPDAPKNDKNDASFSLGSLSEDSMNKVNRKRGGSSSGHETQVNGMHRSYGTSSRHVNVSVESSCRSRDVAEARAQEQKRSGSLHSSKTFESFRPANSSHGASTETVQKKSQPDNLVNDVPGRHHFARTSSSPELSQLTESFGLFRQVSAWAPSNSSRSNWGPRDDDYADTSMHKENLGNELCYEDKRESPRSYSSRISVNSRIRVEGSREVSTAKFPNSTRDKRERKCPPSLVTFTSSEHSSNQAEGNSRIQNSLSSMVTETPERSLGPQFVSSLHDFRLQISEHEWAPSSGPNIVAPAAQVSPGSNQRVADNSGALPFAFYPAGPPVPFVMVPVYNLPTDTENADVLSSHFSSEEGMVNHDSGQNLDSPVVSDQPDISSSSSTPASAEPEEHHSDILNGDFASHWQNLQFGRLCQNSQIPAPLLYPSPMMAPPVNVQGHYLWEGPGRPTSTNPNLFNQFMTYRPRLVPVTPLQPSSSRPAGFYQHYIDESPRYRNGTGTYLPNPASLREQHSRRGSNRSQNASCNTSDHADRERNSKTGSKPRNTGPSKNPGQGHVYPGKSRAQAPWDPSRHESLSSPDSQNSPVMDSECSLSNLTYGVHPSPAFNLNGMSSNGPGVPPLFMFYPYDHNSSYRTTAELLELGSVGSEVISGSVDTSPLNEGTRTGEAYEEQRFDGVTARQTSPDQPSSPHC